MKAFQAVLAILAIALFVGVAQAGDIQDLAKKNAQTFETHCGGSSSGFASGGCGVPQFASGGCGSGCGVTPSFGQTPRFAPQAPSFGGQDVVPTPEPVNSTASLKGDYIAHTVGKPTEDGGVSGNAENHCLPNGYCQPTVLVPVRPVPVRPIVPVRPVLVAAPTPVVGVPTNRGYFYSEQRLGLLGLRGKVVQYHQYGGN